MTSHIIAATTAGIMKGEMKRDRRIPGRRFELNRIRASQIPKKSCKARERT